MLIAHLADLHLGKVQYRLRKRKLDFFNALDDAVNTILNKNVDIIVMAGDVFDSTHPDVETIITTKDILKRANHIPKIIIPGNHDKISSLTGISPVSVLKDLKNTVIVLKSSVIEVSGKKFAAIPKQFSHKEMNAFIKKLKGSVDYLIYHGMIRDTKNEFISRFSNPELPSIKLFKDQFDYVFLGDIHIFMHERVGKTHVVYSSSIEYNSKTEIKNGPRGFVIYDTENDSVEFIKTKTRPSYVLENPEIDAIESLEEGSVVFIEALDTEKYVNLPIRSKFLVYFIQSKFVKSDSLSEEVNVEEVDISALLRELRFPSKLQSLVLSYLKDDRYHELTQGELLDTVEYEVIEYINNNNLSLEDVVFEK